MPHFEVFHLYKPMTVFKLVQVNHLFKRLWIHNPNISIHTQVKLKPGNNGNLLTRCSNKSCLHIFPGCVLVKGTLADSVIQILWTPFRGKSAGVALRAVRWWNVVRGDDGLSYMMKNFCGIWNWNLNKHVLLQLKWPWSSSPSSLNLHSHSVPTITAPNILCIYKMWLTVI